MKLARFLLAWMAVWLGYGAIQAALWLSGTWYWGCLGATLCACGLAASLCLLNAAFRPPGAAGPAAVLPAYPVPRNTAMTEPADRLIPRRHCDAAPEGFPPWLT